MRLFIAIKLSSEVKNTLTTVQKELHSHHITGNYTDCDNLHLTLAFIGEYDDPDTVLETMKQVTFDTFSLCLNGHAGAFGDLWWLGLKKDEQLIALVSDLRKALSSRHIPYDTKPFKPHITIIRKARIPFGEDIDIREYKISKTSMRVCKVSLMHSHRENGKLIYTELGCVEASDGRSGINV